jgi:hypothetical protein
MRLEPICIHITPYIQYTKDVHYTRNGKQFIRKVKLKEPEAHYAASYALLVHDEILELSSVYLDDLGTKWICVSVTQLYNPVCRLRAITPFSFHDQLPFPQNVTKTLSHASEYEIVN